MSISKELFGKLSDGREVYIYTLKNANGMTVRLSEFGAAIVSLCAPDRNGFFTDVVCGFDDLLSYEKDGGSHGSVVGRWANRIAKGKFTLDGTEYTLDLNMGTYHHHGGKKNFVRKIWSSRIVSDSDEPSAEFSLLSPDGDEGYPGNLNVKVTYTLTSDNALSIHYFATTDKKTVINLTNHSYFNLDGYASGSIRDHVLWIDADRYLQSDKDLIPTGTILSAKGTPLDFTEPRVIGKDIDADFEPLRTAGGYDHCYHFGGEYEKEPKLCASLYSPKSGREMLVYTNQPCVQIYSANFMDDEKYPFKGGFPQKIQNAICLETQRMPDGMNHENFTKSTLAPDEVYDYTTVYKFSVK